MVKRHDDNAVPEPIRALRDTFGDPKPPDITRKITACVACRKQKVCAKAVSGSDGCIKTYINVEPYQIKCHMRESNPPCTRCKKRGLPCTVNRSLQMVLESDSL